MGLTDIWFLASAPAEPPSEAVGRAWVLLSVVVLAIVGLLALIVLTLVRYLVRRSEQRARTRRASVSASQKSPWSEAGQRAAPVDVDELDGGADERE